MEIIRAKDADATTIIFTGSLRLLFWFFPFRVRADHRLELCPFGPELQVPCGWSGILGGLGKYQQAWASSPGPVALLAGLGQPRWVKWACRSRSSCR